MPHDVICTGGGVIRIAHANRGVALDWTTFHLRDQEIVRHRNDYSTLAFVDEQDRARLKAMTSDSHLPQMLATFPFHRFADFGVRDGKRISADARQGRGCGDAIMPA